MTLRCPATVAILLTVSFALIAGSHEEGIGWEVQNSTVIFYKDVFLMCSIQNHTDYRNNTRKWKKENTVIMFNGDSSNKSKYEEKILQHGFILIIKTLNMDDVGRNYSCSYGFKTFAKILDLSDSVYELYPNKDTLRQSVNITESDLTALFVFTEVYPVPECNITIPNDQYIINSNSRVISTKKSFFYEVVIFICVDFVKRETSDSIGIKCQIGHSMLLYPTQERKQTNRSGEKRNSEWIAWSLFVVVTIWLIITYIVIYTLRSKGNIFANSELKDHEHQPTDFNDKDPILVETIYE